MFKKKSYYNINELIGSTKKDAFDAGFSYGWDAALKALMDRIVKKENQTEENELQWEAMTNGEIHTDTKDH